MNLCLTTSIIARHDAEVAQLFAHSQSTKDRIQQALDAGYEITIHEAPITQGGWTGAGFSVIDPNTGAGGYLIEGGANGGILIVTGIIIIALIFMNVEALMILGPAGFAIFSLQWQLAISFIVAGIGLLFDFPVLCTLGMSSVMTSILDLASIVRWIPIFMTLYPQAERFVLFNILSGVGLAVCGVEYAK